MSGDSNYFSVPFEYIRTGSESLYDLYVNSSTRESREKYVRIFPKGDRLERKDVKRFRKKYHQLYVHESQRDAYLQSLVRSDDVTPVQKTEVIKDTAIKYLNKIFDIDKEFNTDVLEETIEGCRDTVESMVEVVKDYDIDEIQKLIGDLSFHDFYTYDHSINVSMYSIALYQAINPKAKKEEITMAGLGGLLHDLGKIKIPTTVINKPGKLTDEEFNMIKKHPEYGGELLDDQKGRIEEGVNFEVIRRVVMEHHENYNGTGYPAGLKENEIHEMARVVAIADFFDAITTKRSYHEVLSTEDALEIMAKTIGKKIDPEFFEVFTAKVKGLVLKGDSYVEIEEDFDPCQPHDVLPLKKVEPKKQDHNLFEKNEDYGKVKTKEKKKKKAA